MNELIITRHSANIRLQLLATVSALSLLTVIASPANAEGSDQPTVWIELGGQLERQTGAGDPFAPPFTLKSPLPDFQTLSQVKAQNIAPYAYGGEGAITFAPEDSDWKFSAAIRYGRSGGKTYKHEQTNHNILRSTSDGGISSPPTNGTPGHKTADTTADRSESHAVFDFQAGRDVGVGIFGRGGSSTMGFGVRFAQFNSRATALLHAAPDQYNPLYYNPVAKGVKYAFHRHIYNATSTIAHSFQGIGPSLSWNASAELSGTPEEGGVTFDWGVNAAVLFGRQKTSGHNLVRGDYYYFAAFPPKNANNTHTYYQHTNDPRRSRSVVVPNVGGFAGVSLKWPSAKVTIGYRGDFFVGAMDAGTNTYHQTTRSFYGPFATVSIGLGG